MLQAHYRSIIDISEPALEASKRILPIDGGLELFGDLPTGAKGGFDLDHWQDKCHEAMDDFNTPVLIVHLFDAVKFINSVKTGYSLSITFKRKINEDDESFSFDVLGLEKPLKKAIPSDHKHDKRFIC